MLRLKQKEKKNHPSAVFQGCMLSSLQLEATSVRSNKLKMGIFDI